MNTEYRFEEFTDKDMFECKLKGVAPKFEYITSSKRQAFLTFLEKAGFVIFEVSQETQVAYKVIYNFVYETMGDYRPTSIIANPDSYLIFDFRSRPNKHIKEVLNDGKKSVSLPGFNNAKL